MIDCPLLLILSSIGIVKVKFLMINFSVFDESGIYDVILGEN